jgi:reverse gyrase
MPSSQKKPKAMRKKDLISKRHELRQYAKIVQDIQLAKAQKLSRDPVEFFRQVVGFEPTSYQKEFIKLFLENQFLAARWCRQSV